MKIIFIIFVLLVTLIFSSTSNAKWTKVLELENGISFYIDFDNTKKDDSFIDFLNHSLSLFIRSSLY